MEDFELDYKRIEDKLDKLEQEKLKNMETGEEKELTIEEIVKIKF